MSSNEHNLIQCQLIRISSHIKTLKALSIVMPDIIDQEVTVTSEKNSSPSKYAVANMGNSQESLVVALQELS